MTLKHRIKSKPPKFFRRLRNVGLVLAGVGASIISAPVSLPVALVSIGGYLSVLGGTMAAVSQLPLDHE